MTTQTLRIYTLFVQQIIRVLVESVVNYTESLSSGDLTWECTVRQPDRQASPNVTRRYLGLRSNLREKLTWV